MDRLINAHARLVTLVRIAKSHLALQSPVLITEHVVRMDRHINALVRLGTAALIARSRLVPQTPV